MKYGDEEHPIRPEDGHTSDHNEMLFAGAERGESRPKNILHAIDDANGAGGPEIDGKFSVANRYS